MVLDQVDAVGLQAAERFVQLADCFLLRAAVDLGHQEDLLPIAALQRLPHPELALALVVVPRVVQEVDAVVDRGADDPDAEGLLDVLQAQVPSAETDRRDPFPRAAEHAVRHIRGSGGRHGVLLQCHVPES
jgi:hypothetical protein